MPDIHTLIDDAVLNGSANKTNLNLHTLLTPQTPHMKRQASLDSHINSAGQIVTTVMTHKKRKLIHSNLLAKFAQPCFPMFESQGYNFFLLLNAFILKNYYKISTLFMCIVHFHIMTIRNFMDCG